jgi:hypothetical protein
MGIGVVKISDCVWEDEELMNELFDSFRIISHERDANGHYHGYETFVLESDLFTERDGSKYDIVMTSKESGTMVKEVICYG